MEGALNHLFHSFIITLILYLLMKFALKQSQTMALNYYVDTNSLDYSKTILREMKDCVKRGSDLIFSTIYVYFYNLLKRRAMKTFR